MKDAKKKVDAKVGKAKEKVALKVVKLKAKVKVIAPVLMAALAIGALAGCQNPAQRAQTADTRITIWGGTVSFGNEFVSLAQANETGGNDAGQVASPTNDVKPDIDVSVPVNKAGAAQSVGSVLGDAVASLITGASKTSTSATSASTATASGDCTDGSCTISGACTDGSCSE